MKIINNKIYSDDKQGFDRYKEERMECTGRPTGQGYGAARKGPSANRTAVDLSKVVIDNKEYDYSA
tara:strand:- start:2063 stop:2260 length:198 start_codon:yes stop_codon:yes gene_type:complete